LRWNAGLARIGPRCNLIEGSPIYVHRGQLQGWFSADFLDEERRQDIGLSLLDSEADISYQFLEEFIRAQDLLDEMYASLADPLHPQATESSGSPGCLVSMSSDIYISICRRRK
jgi:hypothetical protein